MTSDQPSTISTSVSVGYAIWMLRGGTLLTAFLSSMPTWQVFDPLAVIDGLSDNEPGLPEGDDESLESLVGEQTGQ